MNIYQSKHDNRSTSSSEYFKQRFTSCESKLQKVNSLNYEKDFLPSYSCVNNQMNEIKQVKSQYEIPRKIEFQQVSKQKQYYHQPTPYQEYSNKELRKSQSSYMANPFITRQLKTKFPIKQDKIYQSSSKQITNPITNPISQIKHQSRDSFIQQLKRNKTKSKYQNRIVGVQNSSYLLTNTKSINNNNPAKHNKENKYPLISSSKIQNPIYNFNNPSDRKQSMPQSYPLYSSDYQTFPQIAHNLLEHIYFTIQNQSLINKVFKQFITNQKQIISNWFDNILKSITNSLNQIKITFQKQVDIKYKTMLEQLKKLKDMSEYMWRDSKIIEKNNNFYGLSNNCDDKLLSSRNSQNKHKIFSQVNQNNILSSKHHKGEHHNTVFAKLSQDYNKSSQSNQKLLKQLHQQDIRLQQYKDTRSFYLLSNNNRQNMYSSSEKITLLKQMYSISSFIGRSMNQCENQFKQQLNGISDKGHLQHKNQQKVRNWLNNSLKIDNQNTNQKQYSNGRQTDKEQIHTLTKNKLQEIQSICNQFKKNIKYQYNCS